MNRVGMKTPQQQGASLIVVLVLLLVLTVLGTDSMQSSLLEMHMSKGMGDYNYAFEAAESGLRMAETVLDKAATIRDVEDLLKTANIKMEETLFDHTDESYWNGVKSSGNGQVKVVVEPWRYVPDNLTVGNGDTAGSQFYRITARGVDPGYEQHLTAGKGEDYRRSRARVIMSSVFAVRSRN